MRSLSMILLLALLSTAVVAQEGLPYVYKFPKAPVEWGKAAAFNNLSPGFFQVMYQNQEGIVRIATYGIVGASMDKLKDPQLMMVFTFDESRELLGEEGTGELWTSKHE